VAANVVSAVYAVIVLAAALGPTILCELVLLGWLSRTIIKTRNELPRSVRTFFLAVDCLTSAFFQCLDRASTAIEDITNDSEVAEMYEISMMCAIFGFAVSPLVLGSTAGTAAVRDPLRTSWLPASSILM
jgi:hypothetical protein